MKQILFYIGMALLFILIVFACEFLGFLSPYLWVYAGAFGALLGAAPIMAMAKKWKKFGVYAANTAIFIIAMAAMGEVSGTAVILFMIFVTLTAELVRYMIGYNSKKGVLISYAIFGIFPTASIITLWIDPTTYYAGTVEELNTAYADKLMTFNNPVGFFSFIAVTFVAGLCGVIIAEKLSKGKISLAQ